LDAYYASDKFGVYIHVPFCVRRCRYCGFVSTVRREVPEKAYAASVLNEFGLRREAYSGLALRTLYVGGGTPSVLGDASLGEMLDGIRASCGEPEELTLEVNPEHVTFGRALGWRELGVTRVSLGVQSFDEATLRYLGRRHSAQVARDAVASILVAGIKEVSIDLIYGAHVASEPEEALAIWRRDLEQARDSGAVHVSCYALIVEPSTPLAAVASRGQCVVESDETQLEMMAMIPGVLGMRAYEVSNYGREGYVSAHNVSCWAGEPYLGLGVGAHSLCRRSGDFVRRANGSDLTRYLADPTGGAEFEEVLSPGLHLGELLICAARTRFRWCPDAIARQRGADLTPYRPGLAKAEALGWITGTDDGVYETTKTGIELNNRLDAVLFEGAPEA